MSKNRHIAMRALRPLAARDYRLLFAAVGIEVFGTAMWTIVMVFQVLALTDSPLALSAVATGMSLGLFAFSVVGGVVADRFSKRCLIITVQVSTAAVMAAVAPLSLTGRSSCGTTVSHRSSWVPVVRFSTPPTFPRCSHWNSSSPRTASKERTNVWGDLRTGVRYVAGTRWLL